LQTTTLLENSKQTKKVSNSYQGTQGQRKHNVKDCFCIHKLLGTLPTTIFICIEHGQTMHCSSSKVFDMQKERIISHKNEYECWSRRLISHARPMNNGSKNINVNKKSTNNFPMISSHKYE